MAKVDKYEWKIDDEEAVHGVKIISLVDEPAMESDFIAFSKIKPKLKFVKLEGEYKQMVAGLALIPEKEIPRVDEDGNEYVGYFSAETIEQIRNKFHKEEQTQNVNTDHEEDEVIDAYLVESFIVTSNEQMVDLKNKGIEEATIGSWYVQYKIEDEDIFKQVLEGEYNGFSVELYANRILESFQYNNNNKTNKFMKNFIEKLKGLLNEFETTEAEVTMERATIPELEITIEWAEIGEAVSKVLVDEAGEESIEPLEDGEYTLEDGRILIVTDGMLTEIQDAPAEEEEPAEEEAEVKAETDEEAEAEVKAEDEVEVTVSAKQALQDLGIDFTQDGYYTVEVGVEGGEPVWGSVYANTYKDLKFKAENFEAKEQEIVDLQKEIDALKAKIKEPIADPKLGFEQAEQEDEVDLSKLSNFERIARKNKLPIV